MTVRAKLRLLSLTHKHDGWIVAELAPVLQRDDAKNAENRVFWEYTPAGRLELRYFGGCALEVGAYYYVDLSPGPADGWLLDSVLRRSNGSGEVSLNWSKPWSRAAEADPTALVGLRSGELRLTLDSRARGAQEALREEGSRWGLAIIFAEGSD